MLDQLTGSSRLYPIIGDPITFVESPVWLTQSFARRGHPGLCIPMQVPLDALDAVMVGLAATPNVDGILVTMPHKHAAFGYCATVSDRARRLGVVSIMRRSADGTWHGDMLDGLAFVKAQVDHGATVEGPERSSSAQAVPAVPSPTPCSPPGWANSSSTTPTRAGWTPSARWSPGRASQRGSA